MSLLSKGFTGNQLKSIGLVLMVFDHIHQMFYYAADLTWMSMLGRPVLPIFLFMCSEGYYHTRSKQAYAFRLLVWAVGMRVVSIFVVQHFFPIATYEVELMNNVFATMCCSVLAMMGIDAIRQKQWAKGFGYLALPVLPLLFVGLFSLLQQFDLARVFVLLPSYLTAEGGPTAVLLAVLFYLFREKRLYQCLVLAGLAALSLALSGQFSVTALLSTNIQWMMVFAIPLLALYNGKKGGGSKYFFYIFYPAHIYVLYLLAYFLLENGLIK